MLLLCESAVVWACLLAAFECVAASIWEQRITIVSSTGTVSVLECQPTLSVDRVVFASALLRLLGSAAWLCSALPCAVPPHSIDPRAVAHALECHPCMMSTRESIHNAAEAHRRASHHSGEQVPRTATTTAARFQRAKASLARFLGSETDVRATQPLYARSPHSALACAQRRRI